MKKRIYYVLVILLMGLIGYFLYFQLNPIHIETSGSLKVTVKDLSELEAEADIILLGKMTKILRTKVNMDLAINAPMVGYTYSEFEVVKAYKGTIQDRMIVIEPYYTYINPFGQKTLSTSDGYHPAKKNQQYLLFLNEYKEGTYILTGAYQGKYPLKEGITDKINSRQALSENDLEAGSIQIKYNYNNLFMEVHNKYYPK